MFIGCDMTFAATSQLEPADETVIISLDGTAVELDLTAEWARDLREKMMPYIRAGHAPGAGPEQPEQPKPSQGHRREIAGTRKFYAGVRAYAVDQGVEIPLASRENGSRTKAKRTYSYPNGLVPAYVAHLEDLAARGDGAAVALLAIAQALGLTVEDTSPAAVAAVAGGTGVRASCARCHHPKALHGSGDGTPCKASGCRSGSDGGPCPGYMILAAEHASR